MTKGEVALFRIGIDPTGVRAKKVCDFINYWTTTDLELDLAIRRYCRLNEIDEVALKQAFYWVKEKAKKYCIQVGKDSSKNYRLKDEVIL